MKVSRISAITLMVLFLAAGICFSQNTGEYHREGVQLRIQEARKAFAELTDIDGAIWDDESGWPIVFAEITKKDISLPPIEIDDLIMAMKVVNEGEDPDHSQSDHRQKDQPLANLGKLHPSFGKNKGFGFLFEAEQFTMATILMQRQNHQLLSILVIQRTLVLRLELSRAKLILDTNY